MMNSYCTFCGGELDTGYRCMKCGKHCPPPPIYNDNRTTAPDNIVCPERSWP